jgi:hypothetical protein
MGALRADPSGKRVPVPVGQARTSVVAVTGSPSEGDVLATVVAELARREDVVIVCGLPMLRHATGSTCLLGRLSTAMPWRTIAVVPVQARPELQEVYMALIEQLRGRETVVVVAVPDAGLMPVAEQLNNRLGADELTLAEESVAGLILQRIPRPSGREHPGHVRGLPRAAQGLQVARGNGPSPSSPA